MLDLDSKRLLARLQEGDRDAAGIIFVRYFKRMLGLARKRLSLRMRSRADEQDIVQSAYHSFFRLAREKRFLHRRPGDLWRLLAGITVNKTRQHVEFHSAAKRNVTSESSCEVDDAHEGAQRRLNHSSTAEETLTLSEELESIMRTLDPLSREVLRLRLLNHSCDEIAQRVDRSPRTVRRVLGQLRETLLQRLS